MTAESETIRYVVALDVGKADTESAVCAVAIHDSRAMLLGGGYARTVRRLQVLGLETLTGIPHAATQGPSVIGTALDLITQISAVATAEPVGRAWTTIEVVVSMGLVGPPFAALLEQQLRERKLRTKPHRLVVTAGYTAGNEDGVFTVPKCILIGLAQLALAERRLEYATELAEMREVVERLRVYRTTIFPPREQPWDQREGGGQDEASIGALCAAVWWGEKLRSPPGPISLQPLAQR
jgi:hypothetical protein